jgi:holo-[acyl-carrier protein] synthase
VVIIGFGSDLCSIPRIEAALARHGERFVRRLFTDIEIARAERRPLTRAGTYAKRFAAKEAASKALGTGFAQGVFFRDIGVVNLPGGRPSLALSGGAAERLRQLTPPGHRAEIWLTLTDDRPFAYASVLIVAVPV